MQFDPTTFTALARVGKPVGLAGMCRIFPLGETIASADLPLQLWVGSPRSITEIILTSAKDVGKGALKATFEGVDSRESVDLLKNLFLYIETERLPDPEEDEYYFRDLIGLVVETESGELWGKISDVFNFPTTDAVEILRNGKKVLLPFRKETVSSVSLEDKKIIVSSEILKDLL